MSGFDRYVKLYITAIAATDESRPTGDRRVSVTETKRDRLKPMVDEIARDLAVTRYGLAKCLHVPIGAVDEAAISTYVGEVQKVLSGGSARMALLVLAKAPPPRDPGFTIWDLDGCRILHQQLQVWMDAAYTSYRRAYRAAFPDEELGDRILSHAMNRRVAALKGFQFVRLTRLPAPPIPAAPSRKAGGHPAQYTRADGGEPTARGLYPVRRPYRTDAHAEPNSISKSKITLSASPCRACALSAAHLRVLFDL